MSISRRALMKAGIAAAGVPWVTVNTDAGNQGTARGGIQFDVTGLALFQRWSKTRKFTVVMPDAKKCGLNDTHAPLLMMSYEDYIDEPMAAVSTFEPTVLRFGSDTMLSWSLAGFRLWVEGSQGDPASPLTFDDSKTGSEPTPIDSDEGWASMSWFPKLNEVLNEPNLAIARPLVTSEILFTQGHIAGRSPVLASARYRKFEIGHSPERSCGTNVSVWHPAPSEGRAATLYVMPIDGGNTMAIRVRLRSDRPARVMISHTPLGMTGGPGPTTAYYRLVARQGPAVHVKQHPERILADHTAVVPPVPASELARSVSQPHSQRLAQGHPPDSDCVPMILEME